MGILSTYDADPRAEERQLLRQICRTGSLFCNHSATYQVAARLMSAGECQPFPAVGGRMLKITTKGRRTDAQ